MSLDAFNTDENRAEDENIFAKDAIMVYQRGFAMVDSLAKHGVIGTAGYGPCFALIMSKPGEILAVAHIDALTDLKNSFSIIAAWVKHSGISDITSLGYTIDGGDGTSRELKDRLMQILTEWGVKTVNDLNPDLTSFASSVERRFVVNVADGIIKKGIFPAFPEDPNSRNAKLLRSTSPIMAPLSPDYIDIKEESFGLLGQS